MLVGRQSALWPAAGGPLLRSAPVWARCAQARRGTTASTYPGLFRALAGTGWRRVRSDQFPMALLWRWPKRIGRPSASILHIATHDSFSPTTAAGGINNAVRSGVSDPYRFARR